MSSSLEPTEKSPRAQDQHEYPGQYDLDTLLQSNALDALGDFDFPYSVFAGPDADVKPSSPQPIGRKRSFSQASNWDNASPKSLSDVNASHVSAGAWENIATKLSAPPESANTNAANSAESIRPPNAAAVGIAARADPHGPSNSYTRPLELVVSIEQDITARQGDAPACGKGAAACKGRRSAEASGGKQRALNPDRMERKASREKRRREEVNERFEHLLQVLEEAESTSGLEPPAAADGQGAPNACINGRRVEVLSRTIIVLKKLLLERPNSSPNAAASVASEEGRICESHCGRVEDLSQPRPILSAAPADPAVLVSDNIGRHACPTTGNTEAGTLPQHPHPMVPFTLPAAAVPAGMVAAAGGSNLASTAALQHMAMPVSGHPPMSMPPGFARMPHSMSGQPIFIAVPMYMPPGQGMAPAEGSAKHQVPVAPTAVASAPGVSSKPGPVPTGANDAWAMPHGAGFQSMMALQMPQFVTQALATKEDDEEPTHAVCA